jgi:hypothetical protein
MSQTHPPKGAQDTARLIYPTTEELAVNHYEVKNITAALEALHQDGFVVLKSVVDISHVRNIDKFMSKEADHLLDTNAKPFNQGIDCMYKVLVMVCY